MQDEFGMWHGDYVPCKTIVKDMLESMTCGIIGSMFTVRYDSTCTVVYGMCTTTTRVSLAGKWARALAAGGMKPTTPNCAHPHHLNGSRHKQGVASAFDSMIYVAELWPGFMIVLRPRKLLGGPGRPPMASQGPREPPRGLPGPREASLTKS